MTYRYTPEDLAVIERRRREGHRPAVVPSMSEKQLQTAVVELAELCGWRYFHTFDARKSVAGYPDLTMVRGPRLLFVELKTETGVVSPAQEIWIDTLRAVPGVRALVWRPTQWLDGTIERELRSEGRDVALVAGVCREEID